MNKRFLLGSIIGFLSLGVIASAGSLLNNEIRWYDNLVNNNSKIFNASDLTLGEFTDDIIVDGITLKATSTHEMKIVEKSAVYSEFNDDGKRIYYREFTQCLKTNGYNSVYDSNYFSGSDFILPFDYRVFMFDVETYSSVDIFVSANNENGEEVEILKYYYDEINCLKVESLETFCTDDYITEDYQYKSTDIFRFKFYLEPGSYFISSLENINIFAIEVHE